MSHCAGQRRAPEPARTYYYDATAGNNANPGTSEGAPLQTMAGLNARTFKPGDRVLLKRGETWAEQLNVPTSGLAGRPILFADYGAGALPIINYGTTDTSFRCYQRSYIHARNLDCRGGLAGGKVMFVATATGVLLDTCTVLGDNLTRYNGIEVAGGTRVFIIGCTISLCKVPATGGAGIAVGMDSAACSEILIRGNTCHTNGTSTLTDHGMYIKAAINTEVARNTCYGNTSAGIKINVNSPTVQVFGNNLYSNLIGISLDTVSAARVFNNLIYSNTDAGVGLLGGTTGGTVSHNTIVNNVPCAVRHYAAGITGVAIKNNIMFNDYATVGDGCEVVRIYDDADAAANTYDYNCGYYAGHTGEATIMFRRTNTLSKMTFAQWQALGADAHGISVNPEFNTDYTNLHLAVGSDCIAAGDATVGVTSDKDGVPRGAAVDIGAYEYV